MSGREAILGRVRRSLGVTGGEADRRAQVEARLRDAPQGVIPARGHLPAKERIALFMTMLEDVNATAEQVGSDAEIPAAVAGYLRRHNLPQKVRSGADSRLASIPWQRQPTLEVEHGPARDADLASLSHAFAGVAESGTLILLSGPENPTTLNFLPETHIVCLCADDILADYETVWARLRALRGKGVMPRTVNMITGPSRSGDIEQTILLGAHGPRRLHVLIVGPARTDGD